MNVVVLTQVVCDQVVAADLETGDTREFVFPANIIAYGIVVAVLEVNTHIAAVKGGVILNRGIMGIGYENSTLEAKTVIDAIPVVGTGGIDIIVPDRQIRTRSIIAEGWIAPPRFECRYIGSR